MQNMQNMNRKGLFSVQNQVPGLASSLPGKYGQHNCLILILRFQLDAAPGAREELPLGCAWTTQWIGRAVAVSLDARRWRFWALILLSPPSPSSSILKSFNTFSRHNLFAICTISINKLSRNKTKYGTKSCTNKFCLKKVFEGFDLLELWP